MSIRIQLTAHYNGVIEDAGNGRVMGRIGADGSILDDGVRLCARVLPVDALVEHAVLLNELSEAIVRLRQIVHATNVNVD